MTKRKHPVLNAFQKYAFLFLGSVLASVGLEIFLIPNNIIDGGVVGISIITSHLTKIPLGLFTFLLNIPFLFFGYKQIGKTFVISSLFSITSLSIWVSLLHPIPGLTNDVLAAITAGALQPKPMNMGIKDFPLRPSFLKRRSMTKAALAIYPLSSSMDMKKNRIMICGTNTSMLPIPLHRLLPAIRQPVRPQYR